MGRSVGPWARSNAWPAKAQALNKMLMIGIALTAVTVRSAARVFEMASVLVTY